MVLHRLQNLLAQQDRNACLSAAQMYAFADLDWQVKHRWLMPVDKVAHSVAAMERGICCCFFLSTFYAQAAVCKCLFVIASWPRCKLLKEPQLSANTAELRLTHMSVRWGTRKLSEACLTKHVNNCPAQPPLLNRTDEVEVVWLDL